MSHAVVAFVLAGLSGPLPDDAQKVVAAIRTAYEANRASLSGHGTIRFHLCDGTLGPGSDAEGMNALLKGPWERRSPSKGLYIFDGAKRRYENLYPPDELVARRHKTSPDTWTSRIFAVRLLSDGETTLIDEIDVAADNKTETHSGPLRAGNAEFFRNAVAIPLELGNPDPPGYDLGNSLARLLEGQGRENMTLVELDEAASLDGVSVVKLRIDDPTQEIRRTFWVDLEHGAIPIQSRTLAYVPHADIIGISQINNADIRWVGKGWLPFRWSWAEGTLDKTGAVPVASAFEVVLDEADFDKVPKRELFRLEFPKEEGYADSDRNLGFGSHKVWDLKDIGPAARARAHPLRMQAFELPPSLPGARKGWGWWPLALLLLGASCLLGAGAVAFMKWRHHHV